MIGFVGAPGQPDCEAADFWNDRTDKLSLEDSRSVLADIGR
jgi:hypothetical protein